MTLASIHKCFMAAWLIVFRLLYAMYSKCLHAANTVGAAESWNIGSGGAGMLLQFQWGSSGAGQEHLKWNRNKRHCLATDSIKSGAEKLCMELPHTVYTHTQMLPVPASMQVLPQHFRHIHVYILINSVCYYIYVPAVLAPDHGNESYTDYNRVYRCIYLPAILAPGRTRVTWILEGFPPTRMTSGIAVMISWRGLPFALTGRRPHVSW